MNNTIYEKINKKRQILSFQDSKLGNIYVRWIHATIPRILKIPMKTHYHSQ